MADIVSRREIEKLIQVRRAINQMAHLNDIVVESIGGFLFETKGTKLDERVNLIETLRATRPASFYVVEVKLDNRDETEPAVIFTVASIEDTRLLFSAGLVIKPDGWESLLLLHTEFEHEGEVAFRFPIPIGYLQPGVTLYFRGISIGMKGVNFDYSMTKLMHPPRPLGPLGQK